MLKLASNPAGARHTDSSPWGDILMTVWRREDNVELLDPQLVQHCMQPCIMK